MEHSLSTVAAVADIRAEAPGAALHNRASLPTGEIGRRRMPEWLVRGVLIPTGIVLSAPIYLVFFAVAAVVYPVHAVLQRSVR